MKSPTVKYATAPVPSALKGKVSLQRGLSLIELMISITIGLLILAALTSLFVNQSKTRVELDKSNRMIDNGRYALEILSDNLRQAGFYGEFSPSATVPAMPGALPDPCSVVPADISAALQLAIQGYEAATQTSQITSPPCSFTYSAGNALSLKPGSDILVIRRASTATPIVQGAALAGTHYLQVSLCKNDDPAVPYIINTDPAAFILRSCPPPPAVTKLADLRNFMVQVYFVSPDNNPGDGIPTLKRRELDPTTHNFQNTPLVEGIEYMQLDYGLDTTGALGVPDGSPDSYITAPTLTQWPNIVAVKINILARNTEATSGYTDTKTYALGVAGNFTPSGADAHYKRHAYTQFVRLVNPADRREPP